MKALSALLTRQLKAGKDGRTPLGAEQSFEEVDGKVDLDEFVQLATLMLTVEKKVDYGSESAWCSHH